MFLVFYKIIIFVGFIYDVFIKSILKFLEIRDLIDFLLSSFCLGYIWNVVSI